MLLNSMEYVEVYMKETVPIAETGVMGGSAVDLYCKTPNSVRLFSHDLLLFPCLVSLVSVQNASLFRISMPNNFQAIEVSTILSYTFNIC
jgi:hypothetical protein